MDENKKIELSQIIMERMELKSTLREIGYLMQVKPNETFSREIDRILDRLKVLEIKENEIKKQE
jgi:hypothetical protein